MGRIRKLKKQGKMSGWAAFAAVFLTAAVIIALGFVLWHSGLPARLYYPLEYKDEIIAACDEYSLDPCLVAAVIHTESRFKPDAVSVDGAVGLMQVLPSTAEWIAQMRGMEYDEAKLTDSAYNIDLGCWLLKYLSDRYEGNTRYALIAYNAGHGRLESWLASDEYTDENGDLAVIPYGETDNYVKRIDNSITQYRKLYGEGLENANY